MRILRSVAIALILGALSALVVAHVCALGRPKHVPPGASGFTVRAATSETDWALGLSSTLPYQSFGVLILQTELAVPPPTKEVIEGLWAGWPYHCVHERWHVRYSTWPSHIYVDDLPTGARLTHAVPLKIIFPGLLANSAFYGLFWLAIPITRQLRCSRRRRRGACESCGYTLSQTPSQACPECGEQHVSRRGPAG